MPTFSCQTLSEYQHGSLYSCRENDATKTRSRLFRYSDLPLIPEPDSSPRFPPLRERDRDLTGATE
ncbi:hypothetical protein [Coleofasciculus sp.]|uniref:hypothetical protein n=1 Tax=Coleofasciculus sp. TaxID=3100458 RepID=UPI0039FAAFD7